MVNGAASALKASLQKLIYFHLFLFEVVSESYEFFKRRAVIRMVLVRQILFTGFEALSIISLIAFVIGAIVILEGNAIIAGFGQSKLFYTIFVSVVTRELACLLTAFIIVARSGTAISTELGNMVINKEIESLLSFGISPIGYLVVPRVLGVIISVNILTIFFNSAAILGAWLMSTLYAPLDFFVFVTNLLAELTIADMVSGFLKSSVFGLLVATISCFEGLKVSMASTEVPQRTIKAVVRSLTVVVLADIVITLLFYFS